METALLRSSILAGAALAAAWTGPARAENEPPLTGEIAVELQHDRSYDSEDPANERNDTFLTVEPYLRVQITSGLSVQALGVLEPAADPAPGRSRFLEDHGLYLQHLTADYEAARFRVFAGKFTPNFGRAWDVTPGVYGVDFTEDYELAERVGLGGGVDFGGEDGASHTLSASTFFLDSSVLSSSAFRDRGRTRHADGGPSNTSDLASFALALDGGQMAFAPGVSYHLGYVHQAEDTPGGRDEKGLVAGLAWDGEFGEYVVSVGAEYAGFRDFGGVDGDEADYWSAWVGVTRGPWNAAAAWTRRDQDLAGGGAGDTLFQLSAGYEFASGLTLDVGWRLAEESRVETRTLGALVTYTIAF